MIVPYLVFCSFPSASLTSSLTTHPVRQSASIQSSCSCVFAKLSSLPFTRLQQDAAILKSKSNLLQGCIDGLRKEKSERYTLISQAKFLGLEGGLSIRANLNGLDRNSRKWSEGSIRDAAREWNRVLGRNILRVESNQRSTDVTVNFNDNFEPESSNIIGRVESYSISFSPDHSTEKPYSFPDGINVNGRISYKGEVYSELDYANLMMHEFGHLLGLADNYDGQGAMSSFRNRSKLIKPSDNERKILLDFFGRAFRAKKQLERSL